MQTRLQTMIVSLGIALEVGIYFFNDVEFVCVHDIKDVVFLGNREKVQLKLSYSRDDGSFSMSQRNNVILNSFLC